jgi:xanthine dehydrogenase molybdopterin-binding subunit B
MQVAQVVARELGISMDLIKLKSSSNLTSPNNITTGGSWGSEMNSFVSSVPDIVFISIRILPVMPGYKNPFD